MGLCQGAAWGKEVMGSLLGGGLSSEQREGKRHLARAVLGVGFEELGLRKGGGVEGGRRNLKSDRQCLCSGSCTNKNLTVQASSSAPTVSSNSWRLSFSFSS